MDNDFFQEIVQNACPSIRMRAKKEIFNKKLTDYEKNDYEKLILQGETINNVLSWQMPDGYFGTRLHTPPSNSKVWSHEGCVKYLLEMGFSTDFHPLKKALDIMLLDGRWENEFIGSKAGQVIDGCSIIRSSLFSQAGLHNCNFVQKHIENALDSFKIIADAKKESDMFIPYKDKYIYVNGKYLPQVYDFWILAFTYSWRTKENLAMLSKAYKKLYEWLPFPPTYIKAGSQLVAPCGTTHLPLNSDFSETAGILWFHFYEVSARMGILSKRSPFYKHFNNLFDTVKKTRGRVFSKINKKGYFGYSSYSGLPLEDNWTKKQNKINDLVFRCYLIDNYINAIK